MATSRTITDAQIIERLKAHNKMCVTQYKKVNEELIATRNNQHILIDLLADTMKRLREAEAALEEEKKKHSPLASLLHRNDPWRTDLWESGARAYEALLASSRPCEAQPSTKEPSVDGAAAAAASGTSTSEDDDLYA